VISQNRIDELASVALIAGPDTYLLVQESIRLAVIEASEACAQIVDAPHWKTVVRNECRMRAKTIRARYNLN